MSEPTRIPKVKRYTLYRFYDRGGCLLYVGLTGRPRSRWKEHSETQPWWPEVATATVEHFASVEDLSAAEVAAIREEMPKHNVAHQKPKPTCYHFSVGGDKDLPERLDRVMRAWGRGEVPTRESWDILPGDVFDFHDGARTRWAIPHDELHDTLISFGGYENVVRRFVEVASNFRGDVRGAPEGSLFLIYGGSTYPGSPRVCPQCSLDL